MPAVLHGPSVGEGPLRRYGPARRVAVLSDVHGNVPALEAVLTECEQAQVDLVVFCGDLTWGPEPQETIDLVKALGEQALFVRGNAERAILEIGRGTRAPIRPREHWMVAQHSPAAIQFLASFAFTIVVDVVGMGWVRFCHGSPRSDHELVTPATPVERLAELAVGVEERVIVSGHTHLQFDRNVSNWRSINPGSVGLPYHDGEPGTAYWAIVGPDVSLQRTRYDVGVAVRRGHQSGDPMAEKIASMLMRPPTPQEIIADAEKLVFSD